MPHAWQCWILVFTKRIHVCHADIAISQALSVNNPSGTWCPIPDCEPCARLHVCRAATMCAGKKILARNVPVFTLAFSAEHTHSKGRNGCFHHRISNKPASL